MAPGEAETLLLDRDGPVATLTINRPDRLNALTYAMFSRLPALLAEAAAMDGVRVLVLRGAGRRSFSAGADISEFETARTTPEQAAAYDNAVLTAEEALATFPAPTIAAIHGHCYGGGCALAIACDLRFAASGARFAITPAKLGIVYPLRATRRLVDLVGPSRAKFILMSGIDIDAARAAAIGLVDEVHDDLDGAVAELRRHPRRPLRRHPARRQADDRPRPRRRKRRRRRARRAARGRPRLPRLRRGRPRVPRAPSPEVRIADGSSGASQTPSLLRKRMVARRRAWSYGPTTAPREDIRR